MPYSEMTRFAQGSRSARWEPVIGYCQTCEQPVRVRATVGVPEGMGRREHKKDGGHVWMDIKESEIRDCPKCSHPMVAKPDSRVNHIGELAADMCQQEDKLFEEVFKEVE